jgi:molybdate transport system substrate-binding protein
MRAWVIAVFLGLLSSVNSAQAADSVLVFAAASLKESLDAAESAYMKANPSVQVSASYAASGTLAKQIDSGAPADIFISADIKWMEYLADKHQIVASSRVDLLGNTLVLVAPADAKTGPVTIDPTLDLAALLGDNRLAIGDPQAVPAGDYAKAALESLGLWDSVKDKVASADSVRAALLLVDRHEAPFGIVYGTDALVEPGVKIVGTFPESSHKPIIYPAGLVQEPKPNLAAASFLAWLKSPLAASYFVKAGFVALTAKGS